MTLPRPPIFTAILLALAGCAHGPPPLAIAPTPEPRAVRDTPALALRLAEATLSAGDAATALHVLDTLLAREPNNVPALLRRGNALVGAGRAEEAAESFARAVVLRPGSIEALSGLASARADAGDAKAAEAAWRQALAEEPRNPHVKIGLAITLDLQDRHSDAQALYRAVLAAHPDEPAARADLGLSLALSGNSAEALPLLRRAAAGGFGANTRDAARARNDFAAGLMLAGDEMAARTELSAVMASPSVDAAIDGLRRFAVDGSGKSAER